MKLFVLALLTIFGCKTTDNSNQLAGKERKASTPVPLKNKQQKSYQIIGDYKLIWTNYSSFKNAAKSKLRTECSQAGGDVRSPIKTFIRKYQGAIFALICEIGDQTKSERVEMIFHQLPAISKNHQSEYDGERVSTISAKHRCQNNGGTVSSVEAVGNYASLAVCVFRKGSSSSH